MHKYSNSLFGCTQKRDGVNQNIYYRCKVKTRVLLLLIKYKMFVNLTYTKMRRLEREFETFYYQ